MNASELVAWNLRRLRVAQGLSQEALAFESGVDRSYVGRMERGLENVTIRVLERLAERLGAELAEFFRVPDANEKPPEPLPGGRRPK